LVQEKTEGVVAELTRFSGYVPISIVGKMRIPVKNSENHPDRKATEIE